MSWKPIPAQRRTVGPYIVDYLRGSQPEGGHEIAFPDGRRLRVLPDGTTTGKRRSHLILSGLEAAAGLRDSLRSVSVVMETPTFDDLAYIVGLLEVAGIHTWAVTSTPVTAEAVIADWAADWEGNGDASKLIAELEAAGYTIVEAG